MCSFTHFFCFLTNNKNMEILFIVIAIVVVIITININISIEIEYNIFKNIGKLTIKVFRIPFFKSEISLIAGYFNLMRKNRKVLQIKVDFDDKNFKFIKDVGNYFTKKIFITELYSDFELSSQDPSTISIIAGYVIVLEGLLRSYISCKSPDTEMDSNTQVKFKENNIKFRLKVGVLITIFDFIWSIIRASVKRSLYGKTKEFGRNS